MKIGHTYDVQNPRPLETSERKQKHRLMNFFHTLFHVKNSHEEKLPREHIFEPRPRPYPLVRRDAAFFDNQLLSNLPAPAPKQHI